ncbi:MAG: MFS transporter [Thermomicrobiales bacterium]
MTVIEEPPVSILAQPDPEPAPDEPASALGALRNVLFRQYVSTLAFSMTGMWVRITALGYLVYDLTGDPFKLGLMSFAQAVPELVAGPLAGAYLDRIDRRKVLLVTQSIFIVSMIAILILLLTGNVQYWHLIVAGVLIGTVAGFDWPARLSVVPALVKRSELQSAVALNSAAFNGARITGPTIAGWLISGFGVAWCYAYSAVASLPFIWTVYRTKEIGAREIAKPTVGAFATLIEGYRYIWRHKTIRSLLSVDIVPIALGMSYVTMAPAFVSDVLDLGGGGLGLLLAANGVGSLAGTLAVAALSGYRHRGLFVIIGVAAFGILMMLFAGTSSLIFSLPAIAMLGLVIALYGTMNDTLIQTSVDDAYRGRVMAAYSMFWGLTPIGGLFAGWLADIWSVQWALAINGLLVLCYVPYLWFGTPIRHVK